MKDGEIQIERYFSPQAVAKALGVVDRTVLNRIADGTLPAIKVGHLWRIRESDYLRFVGQLQANHEYQRVLRSLPLDCLNRMDERHEAEARRRLGEPA